jgi:hypothetical protein
MIIIILYPPNLRFDTTLYLLWNENVTFLIKMGWKKLFDLIINNDFFRKNLIRFFYFQEIYTWD